MPIEVHERDPNPIWDNVRKALDKLAPDLAMGAITDLKRNLNAYEKDLRDRLAESTTNYFRQRENKARKVRAARQERSFRAETLPDGIMEVKEE